MKQFRSGKRQEGEQRTTANLIHLPKSSRAAGMKDKAIAAMQAACELTPEFYDLLKLAQWLRGKYEVEGRFPRAADALNQLEIAESFAESDEERSLADDDERTKCLIAARRLDQAIRDLTLRLQNSENGGESIGATDNLE
ncbi:MAG: hypothetical protein U0936_02740 [Planctomycetaceae bacterium]